jgi:hypothetical protein
MALRRESFPLKRKLFRIIFLLIYSIVVIEVTVRVMLAFDPIFARVLDFDSTSERLKWVKRHAYVDILYDYEMYSPTRGWVLQPNLRDKVVGDTVLNTNSRGWRGVEEYDEVKSANQRIMVLGDSFTFGMDVADNQTYAHHLSELLPQTEVLNLGVPGYGHDQMLLYYQEEGVKYRPDVVIIGFVSLDLDRNTMSFKNYAKPKFELDANHHLYLTHVPVPPPAETLRNEIFHLKFIDLLSVLYFKISVFSGIYPQYRTEISTAILDELIRSIKDSGATPVLVYLPIKLYHGPEEDFFNNYCQQQAVACLSLQDRFIKTIPSEAQFRSYTDHWQPPVHQIAAEGIKEFLLEQQIFPPQ